MDVSESARDLEIDESQYLNLLRVFEGHAYNDLADLTKALGRSDFHAVHTAAHSLKGASGSLNLWRIHDAASEICTHANDGFADPIPVQVTVITGELQSLSRLLAEGKKEG